MAQHAVASRPMSVRLACVAFSISETCYRYQGKFNDENSYIANLLIDLTEEQSDWGFGLCFSYLRNVKSHSWNHKRVYRIYCELALNLRIRPRRRLNRNIPEPLKEPTRPNQVWSIDFMHDQLADGRKYRLFNVIDDFKREGLAMEAGFSLSSQRVIRILGQRLEWRKKPIALRCDNGPEFISHEFVKWAKKKGIRIDYIQPGNPQQNAYIERYNRTARYGWMVVLPMVKSAGIDLLWFGTFIVLVVEMSQITPPVRFNLFVIQSLTGKNILYVTKAAQPFFLLIAVTIILITWFPEIVTYLPTSMSKG